MELCEAYNRKMTQRLLNEISRSCGISTEALQAFMDQLREAFRPALEALSSIGDQLNTVSVKPPQDHKQWNKTRFYD